VSSVTFDGPNRLIRVAPEPGPLSAVSAARVYSAWKEWVLEGTGARFVPAFGGSVGGDDLGGGIALDAYIFVRNDLGWRILPDDRDHELQLAGNLYPANPAEPMVAPVESAATVAIALDRSSRSLAPKGLDPQSLRDAMQLAPTDPADSQPGSIDTRIANAIALGLI